MIRQVRLGRPGVEVWVRVLADTAMLAASLGAAYAARILWELRFGSGTADLVTLTAAAGQSLVAWAVLLIGSFLATFAISGGYSRGRGYRLGFKAVLIAQAVAVAHLVTGACLFLFPGETPLPRGVLLVNWIVSTMVLLISRLWSTLWRQFAWSHSSAPTMTLNEPERRHVLLIGGAGYIGSALLPKLLSSGHRVRLLDLFMFGDDPVKAWLSHPGVEVFRADFRQIDRIVEATSGVDSVIHLGGIVGDPACALDEKLTIEINLMATKMIAEVAKGLGVRRLVFASTCSVYGASDFILDEHSKLTPLSLYAMSKLASEQVLLQMRTSTFQPVILRFGTIFGFSGRTRFDLVVNLLTAKAIIEKKITLFGGDQWRPFLHVDDAAAAVLAALSAPIAAVGGEVFNVGSDAENYTLGGVAEIIKRLVPDAEIIEMGANQDRRNYRVSFKKIKDQLRFEPAWTVERGVEQVAGAIRNGSIKNYKDPAYSNVAFLSEEGLQGLAHHSGWEQQLIQDARSEPS